MRSASITNWNQMYCKSKFNFKALQFQYDYSLKLLNHIIKSQIRFIFIFNPFFVAGNSTSTAPRAQAKCQWSGENVKSQVKSPSSENLGCQRKLCLQPSIWILQCEGNWWLVLNVVNPAGSILRLASRALIFHIWSADAWKFDWSCSLSLILEQHVEVHIVQKCFKIVWQWSYRMNLLCITFIIVLLGRIGKQIF